MNRRFFLGAAAAAPVAASQTDRLRGAILGVGNRGTYHVKAFKEHGAIVAAVCDVYETHLQRAVSLASPGAKGYEDYRKVLEDKSLDFVVVSTPDHWHARMAVDAMEAGKDVYLEKPIAHTIEEGYEVMDTARRLKRVVQVGTQRRSNSVFHEALTLMGDGGTGPVRLVDSWWHSRVEKLKDAPLEGKLN
ncbi:MAG: Gfo/Idh/MocA family oxidoreductase, partial [bacterium]|nr:Gfo/Idh/MocA family oxidoreductase [bacterium]